MNNALTIRALAPSEAPLMRRMLDMFGVAFGDRDTYSGDQPADAYLMQLLGSNHFVAIAALEGSSSSVASPVTYCRIRATEIRVLHLRSGRRGVAPAPRRRGVATAMIEELKRSTAARGIYVIFVQADQGDDAAIALYSKLGIREEVLHFGIGPHQREA